MNILYINHYAGSTGMGMEFRPYYLSREWVKMGHKVTVIAGDYSHLRIKNPDVLFDFQEQNIDGITYTWIRTGKYEGNGSARALSMFRFVGALWINAKKISKKWKPDVVIASSTYPLDTYPAQKIARISNARYIHEVHDMWPSTLYEVGNLSKHHPFVMLMQLAENSAYEHCDKCVSLLPYSKGYMVKHGLSPNKFINIQNGVVEEEWNSGEKIPVEHQRFFEEHFNQFIVGYFGGHAMSNALDKILDIAAFFMNRVADKDIIFVFVGEGTEKKRLIERAKRQHIKNACFLPSVNKKAIPDLLSRFDCIYMTGSSSPLYRFGLCLNKMYDSMMAAVPVICAFNAPETLIKTHRCGFQCDPGNMDTVVKSIRKIKAMSNAERKQMGMNGKKVILQHYTYNHLANDFLNKITE